MESKVQRAIDRLRMFEPEEGYFLAFSGGKDSVCIKALADMAGVKYDAHYSVTTVDPPELVRFIRQHHPDVVFERPELSMRQLIIKKQFPPSRLQRYCCEQLKEIRGTGRVVITGVRWAESANRKKKRGIVNIDLSKKAIGKMELKDINGASIGDYGIIFNSDNDDARRTVEHCYRTNKVLVNPIVDWEDADVWGFIRGNGLPYCSLYDEGFDRLGCIGCPLSGTKQMMRGFERWPAYRRMYVKAFDKMIEARREAGKKVDSRWKDGESVMAWWLGAYDGVLEGQVGIFDEEE